MTGPHFAPPRYDDGGLADVLPGIARALGIDIALPRRPFPLDLGEARSAVVVLIDGLGHRLLSAHAAHTPYLRGLLKSGRRLQSGFPSTTANSLSTLGTGLLPGGHGVVGYRVLDPELDVIVNQLTWNAPTDPTTWVPGPTLLEMLSDSGLDVVSFGEAKFAGRGLNQASLRGGRFVPSKTLRERVDQVARELRGKGKHLAYLYWGELDKIGHQHGVDSWAWLEELERIDSELRRLAGSVPADTLLLVTADHGMVDVPHASRLDLADRPDLRTGIRHVGGEPRAVHLYTDDGAAPDVAAAWREGVGGKAEILTRDETIDEGLLGPVAPRNIERIGNVLCVSSAGFSVVDSEHESPAALSLIGHHGGLTQDELEIPLLSVVS